MSGKKEPILYWDACIYLAWLNGDSPSEQGHIEHLPDIEEIIKKNETQQIKIVTSQITMIEVLTCMRNQEAERKFQSIFNGRYNPRYDVDFRIAAKAREIRDHYLNSDPKRVIRTPDAIHLATAVILKVDEFHTFDNSKNGKGSLLALDGDPFLGNLKITKPQVSQADLPLLGFVNAPSVDQLLLPDADPN